MNLVDRLKEGAVQTKKRWTGDVGEFSLVDEVATDNLLREAARHIESLTEVLKVRPEPSRLEIAAMLLGAQPPPQAGSFTGQAEHALRRADALIEAACAGGALIAAADAGGGPGTGAPEYGSFVDGKWVGAPMPQVIQSSGGSGGCSPQ
jgi:hypothetical protein